MDFLQLFINFSIKKAFGGSVKNEIISSKALVEELHKPIIRKFKKRKVHSTFIDNVWHADLADMQLISKFNKDFYYVLLTFITNVHGLFIPLKDRRGITIINAIQKFLDESKFKPNKIWVDKSIEFYNRGIKLFLQTNGIKMYLTHNEGKSERFIKDCWKIY